MANYASSICRTNVVLDRETFSSPMVRGLVMSKPYQFACPLVRIAALTIQPPNYASVINRVTLDFIEASVIRGEIMALGIIRGEVQQGTDNIIRGETD